MVFMIQGLVVMIPGGFLPSLPGWFKYKLSAGGVKWDVENTPKSIRLICILAQRSCKALPGVGRLWPSEDDEDDEDDEHDEDDGDLRAGDQGGRWAEER